MQQLISLWSSLEPRRRVMAVVASLAVIATVVAMSKIASSPTMSLLYAGMESEAAGEVVAALEQQSVTYEIRGDSIFVEATRRDELRMILAGEGLPASDAKGYELLDSLSGFGTTSQMFDAAYWRAKEGELARTMVASPFVKSARVHISNQSNVPFQQAAQVTASASVTGARGPISAQQAQALQYLIASAVSGLNSDEVSIIDAQTGAIINSDTANSSAGQTDRAQVLKESVERILAAHVGPNGAIVEVSVETETSRETILETVVDPSSRVAISTDTEQRNNTASDSGANGVTVASNVAEGDAAGDGTSSSQNNESRERINYEVSETQREILKAPGTTKRITVAVLVNGSMTTDETGREVFVPRDADELAAIEELVASAVGYDEQRGDVITIKSLQFEPVQSLGTEASSVSSAPLDMMSLIQLGVLAVVSIILGLFVVRPILSSGAALPSEGTAIALPPANFGSSSQVQDAMSQHQPNGLTGEIQDGPFPPPSTIGNTAQSAGHPALVDPATTEQQDPVSRLKDLIDERQDETIEILRSWMENDKEEA